MSHILTHELTHYTHGDSLWNLIRALCLTVYWFNPLVWAAASLSRRDCELACDEGVIARLGEENRFAYGRTLVGMAAVGGGMGGYAALLNGNGFRKSRSKGEDCIDRKETQDAGVYACLSAWPVRPAGGLYLQRRAPGGARAQPIAPAGLPLEDEAQPQGDEAAGTDSVGLLKFGPGGEVLAVRSLLSAPETAED